MSLYLWNSKLIFSYGENRMNSMNFLTGSSKSTWQPVKTVDTTTSSYWFNWRVLLCGVWLLISMVFSSIVIHKYEGARNSKQESREAQQESAGVLYDDEIWRPCLKGIHPGWLLAFRIVAFFVLLALWIINVAFDGDVIFYFYTQWTFMLVTFYFGIGSLLSMYGCYQYHKETGGDRIDNQDFDAEQGTNAAPTQLENSNASNAAKCSGHTENLRVRQTAGFLGYAFQIIFQINTGAVMLTDCVFWFILVPYLLSKDYSLNFSLVNMHTVNAVLLLGDTALNCMPFPWFRMAYFFLWADVYVIFQWIVHASVSIGWPYPFLDLSSPFAPLWYLLMALMQFPCYGIFALIMKTKQLLFAKWFPQSYRGAR
ncbi:uncharacterized protein LOC132284959 [Cornus florida]|uniref:uncharacterized protein LOC132284959 n=1 Tax=Cornus florida TaxID=4283 RepID=UPI0028A2950B|nr:uncharacterized protein LOC132284959 [Cornus florida]